MPLDDPILERERIMEMALRGELPGVSAEEAQAGLDAAREYMKGGYAGRSPGLGVIHEWAERNDEHEILVAVTDGTRNPAIRRGSAARRSPSSRTRTRTCWLT